ncbi:hypothetical protein FSP39_017607 [Pinctada imbricata]|uniref:Membrane-associated tyrosine- and threonine-specific cdc2-inhibitory kinase n=1 Tax=Pinctada imbricata TaxID=66713 RepID=A0AA89C0A8_PINIB|nr:hypothetical protein FSP39_017607 [Pinctada imbricata]
MVAFVESPYNASNKDLYFEKAFQVISRIGAGSFGEVFKVKSKEDGKLYAVKKSRDRFRGESDRKRRFEEVAKHETLPHHQNCVKFYRAWEERQYLYIQTELCRMSLSDYTEKYHDLPESTIANFLVDLLMALKHLHDHNLVHMDIKPDNIFTSYDDICKLGDFGLVLDLSKGTDLSEAQEGDPKYLAPELMDGKFGKPADIFSLGMTILELASDLDLPRGGEGWHLLRSGQLPEEFLRCRSFDMKYVIHQMLDRDATSRPTVDQVLAFPYVRKVWKRRRREYIMKSAMSTFKSVFYRILEVLFLFTTVFTPTYWRSALPSQSSSFRRSSSSEMGLDNSISDDECFEDDNNIHNNSIGSPLDSSTSSDSFLYEFAVPCQPPPRKAFTTPIIRRRPQGYVSSPKSSSPVLPSSSKKQRSPNSTFESSFDEERPVTPTYNSSPHNLLEGEEQTKPGIEPKNLMDMFEAASDEEDD